MLGSIVVMLTKLYDEYSFNPKPEATAVAHGTVHDKRRLRLGVKRFVAGVLQ